MTKWINHPHVDLTTVYGPVRVAFTDKGHAYVGVEAHINDDKPALVYRGDDYIGSVHLYAEPKDPSVGPWAPRERSDASWTRRPQWTDAPRTYAVALTIACRDAVLAYLAAEGDDILYLAEYAAAMRDLSRLESERQELMDQVHSIDVRIMDARSRRLHNMPPNADELEA